MTLVLVSACQASSVVVSSLPSPVTKSNHDTPSTPVPPVAAPLAAYPGPMTPQTTAAAALTITAEFPAGAWQRLNRPSMAAQATSALDLQANAIKDLRLTVNGSPCPDEQWRVTSVNWTTSGGITATLRLSKPLPGGLCDVTLTNSSGTILLRATAAAAHPLSLTAASTAQALLIESLGAQGPNLYIPRLAIASVAQRITHLLVRNSTESLLSDRSLQRLVAALAAAITTKKPLHEYDVQAIERSVGLGTSGGGSGAASATATPVSAAPLPGPTTIEQLGAQIAALVASQVQGICQTFVVPGTGHLQGFAIDLAAIQPPSPPQVGFDGIPVIAPPAPPPPPTPITVSLFATDATGRPTGPSLATATAFAQPNGGLLDIPVPPVPVTGGELYALVVTPRDGGAIAAPTTTGDPYTGGSAMRLDGDWKPVSDADLRFRVNLAP